MYEFESLHDLFLAFGHFLTFEYLNFLPFFICLSLIETILVICLHAIAGHGLRFDWCFRSRVWLPSGDKVWEKKNQGIRQSLHFKTRGDKF